MKPTFIAKTKDGINCYWGKKDSSDMESRDLSFWITLRRPREDAKNYYRVPPEAEDFKCQRENWGKYDQHMIDLISSLDSKEINTKWIKCS